LRVSKRAAAASGSPHREQREDRMSLIHHAGRLVLAGALLLAAACSSASPAQPAATAVQPGSPGAASRTVPAAPAPAAGHVQADVRFMQDMIAHHRQAVELTALVPARSQRPEIRALAQRIAVSQDDEILQMESWLRTRGEPLTDAHAHHGVGHHGHQHGGAGHGTHSMPGMLTGAQLAQLRAATGAEFDRLFLEFMIFHHEGALAMVELLFAADGAGRETEIFLFASHVESDQRIEIDRMRRMLNALQRGSA
jgi:uncharacterized protein (DUF305 family)